METPFIISLRKKIANAQSVEYILVARCYDITKFPLTFRGDTLQNVYDRYDNERPIGYSISGVIQKKCNNYSFLKYSNEIMQMADVYALHDAMYLVFGRKYYTIVWFDNIEKKIIHRFYRTYSVCFLTIKYIKQINASQFLAAFVGDHCIDSYDKAKAMSYLAENEITLPKYIV